MRTLVNPDLQSVLIQPPACVLVYEGNLMERFKKLPYANAVWTNKEGTKTYLAIKLGQHPEGRQMTATGAARQVHRDAVRRPIERYESKGQSNVIKCVPE